MKGLLVNFIFGLAMLVFVLALVLLGAGCVVGIHRLLSLLFR